ncbi:MAG: TadE/TadG family type IV pilus assembly protein [Hyphomicrobiaceae bacterium]
MNRKRPAKRVAGCGRSFLKNNDGQVAIEMALVSVPFLTMMFGIINTGMFFYAVNCIDRGLEDASRFIRTGEAQKGTYPGGSAQMTAGQFKNLVCAKATGYIDCSKLQIRIFSAANWAGVNPYTCATSGNLTTGAIASNDTTAISTTAGTQSSVVLITACYQWTMGKYLPFAHFDSRFSDGSSLIQSSTALKIEPYI